MPLPPESVGNQTFSIASFVDAVTHYNSRTTTNALQGQCTIIALSVWRWAADDNSFVNSLNHVAFALLLSFPSYLIVSFLQAEGMLSTSSSYTPLATQDLFHSTSQVRVLRCGHTLHKKCLDQLLRRPTALHICPLCSKTLNDHSFTWHQVSCRCTTPLCNLLNFLSQQLYGMDSFNNWYFNARCSWMWLYRRHLCLLSTSTPPSPSSAMTVTPRCAMT